MAISKEKKKDIWQKVEKIADDSSSVVFVSFNGLTVSDATKLRRELKKEEVGFFVAKKSIIKKALEGKKIPGEMPKLVGEVGMAFGKDLIAPARGINEFSKKKKDILSILGGVFEGKFVDGKEMLKIASIPAMPVLRGMFVNVINSPIQGFVLALNEIAKKKS